MARAYSPSIAILARAPGRSSAGRQAALGSKREFVDAARESRRAIYADQREAARISRLKTPLGKRPGVVFCGWNAIPVGDKADRVVELHRQEAEGVEPRAFYTGLQKCGLGWLCPVCGRAAAEAARADLNGLLSLCRREGWPVVMLTLTARHDRTMGLRAFWDALHAAQGELLTTRPWRALAKLRVGFVKAIEVTHGENGWHPHYHVLIPLRAASDAEAQALVETLREEWLHQLGRQGLTGNDHAFDVRGGGEAGEYFAKWGAAEELTLASAKGARRGGRSLARLLRASREGDAQAGHLWWEAVSVLKGVHRLRWSPELRALVAAEVDRLEAQAQAAADAKGELPPPEMIDRVVASFGEGRWSWARHRRVRLLEVAEGASMEAAREAVAVAIDGPTDEQVMQADRDVQVVEEADSHGAIASGAALAREGPEGGFERGENAVGVFTPSPDSHNQAPNGGCGYG